MSHEHLQRRIRELEVHSDRLCAELDELAAELDHWRREHAALAARAREDWLTPIGFVLLIVAGYELVGWLL